MAITPKSLDYSDRDFDSLLARLVNLSLSVFPAWTDDQRANFGNILRELFAHVGDVLAYYQDNQARESRIATAVLRKSLIALSKLIAYVPSGRTAAQTEETFVLAAVSAGTVTLPAGTNVLTVEVTDPIAYQLLEELVFDPGETTKTATVENSVSEEESFASSGLANQSFKLSTTPYVDGSAVVSDAIGADWEEVVDFLSSDATDAHFVVGIDADEYATISFGNGVNGRVPAGTVTVASKTGGGAAGAVEAGKLTRLEGTFTDSLGAPAIISVTNADASSAEDRETEEQIRQNAPAANRVQGRAVAREDYEISAEQVAGVARAFHGTINEGVGVGENEGILFVVPVGGGVAGAPLLAEVAARFAAGGATPGTNTYVQGLQVRSAAYRVVDVSTTVYLRAGYSGAAVKANVIAALEALFAVQEEDGTRNEAIDFGYYYQDEDGAPTGELPWSDVHDAVRDAAGVRKVDPGEAGLLLDGERDDVTIEPFEFPKLGTVVVIDGTTGDTL